MTSSAQTIGKTVCPSCRSRGKDTRGDNLILYSDGGVYCFACGYLRTASGMLKLEPQEVLKNPLSLPDDIEPLTKDKPGYTWLSKYLDKIPAWILWSEYKQWLIFPYIINGNLEAWQARNFSGFGPKWLTFGNVKTLYYFCGSKHAKCVVLVEDIVSADVS